MDPNNTTIISDTFDKKDLKQLFDKQIDETTSELEYYGPEFDIDHMSNESRQVMSILNNFE